MRAREPTGVTEDELDELLFQIAAYCGVPAGIVGEAGGRRGSGDGGDAA